MPSTGGRMASRTPRTRSRRSSAATYAAARPAASRVSSCPACAAFAAWTCGTGGFVSPLAIVPTDASVADMASGSDRLQLEARGVRLRILAVPHDPVDELRAPHDVLRQRRLRHGRGLLVDVDLVHLRSNGQVIRVFLEQAPPPVLSHEPHAVGEERE